MNKNHNRFQRWQSNPDVKKYANRLFLQFAFLSHLPFYYKRDTNSFLTVLLVCCLFSSLHCSSFLSSCLHYHPFILKLACYPFDLLIGVSLPSSFWAPSSVPSDFAFSKLTPFLLLFLPLFILRVSSFFFWTNLVFVHFPLHQKMPLWPEMSPLILFSKPAVILLSPFHSPHLQLTYLSCFCFEF